MTIQRDREQSGQITKSRTLSKHLIVFITDNPGNLGHITSITRPQSWKENSKNTNCQEERQAINISYISQCLEQSNYPFHKGTDKSVSLEDPVLLLEATCIC